MREEKGTLNLRNYLGVALPFMLANITQPLIGAVDTAMLGKLSSPVYMAGIAIGTAAFNTVYWLFGFFKATTAGYHAEAVGRGDERAKIEILFQTLIMALVIGLVLVVGQKPIWSVVRQILKPDPLVEAQTLIYCRIVVWGHLLF